jgi:hypothetical protein
MIRVMHPRSLLRQLTRTPLEKPCDSPWESMAGSDKVRHCTSCDRDVYSLSDMSELEAELRLLNSGDAVPCIRYARDRDGLVAHLAPPPPRRFHFHFAGASARALVVASALVARDAVAQGKDKANEPVQCVMLSGLAPSPAASASAPAKGAAPAPAAAAAPASPPPPVPLAGAAPPPQHEVAYGTLTIRSKVPRELELQGIKLQAPLALFRMTPGDFVVELSEPGKKKKRKIKFSITVDQQTTLDLDKR